PNQCRGACCRPDGTCFLTTIYQCVAPNAYLGGTPCTPNPCPQSHACCDLTACFLWYGPCPQGTTDPGTLTCVPNPCVRACCRIDGSCFTIAGPCPSGTTPAPGNTCTPNNCPPPTHACCDVNACFIFTGTGCPPGTIDPGTLTCTPNPCPGACCIFEQPGVIFCILTSADSCAAQGGVFLGGPTCTPNPCNVACCRPDGSCVVIAALQCPANSTPAPGNTCTPNPCPGACCRPDGSCIQTSASQCPAPNVFFPGAPCPAIGCRGACCCGTRCFITTPQACQGTARRFVGLNTVCNPPGNNTTPCCKADFNQSGTLTVQDIFDFLAAYFAGNLCADINESGTLTVQDIFNFLAAYFAGCP
ncbi:MAG: GC-type dockerin domain-anchored protein, partial [Phycisphaerales bacterium]